MIDAQVSYGMQNYVYSENLCNKIMIIYFPTG